jgi:aryl-phospho-beta-D-glucosidase BglC (GH1 family)
MVTLKKKTVSYGLFLGFTLFLSNIPLILGFQGSQSISSHGTIIYNLTWLHTEGTRIVDESGQEVKLYAVNVHYGGGQEFELEDVQKIKSMGFNAFRIHIYWGLIQPYNETLEGIDESYFSSPNPPLGHGVDDVVDWAEQERMYLILCICWTQTWDVPSWAFPSILGNARFDALIDGSAARERTGFVNLWRFIANRYKNKSHVLFEFINEPCVSDESLAGSAYKTFNEEIIDAVESVETRSHIKIIELLVISGSCEEILSSALDIARSSVVWATHRYQPWGDYDPSELAYCYDYDSRQWGWYTMDKYIYWRVRRCADEIHSWSKPWLNTEFGKGTASANWSEWLNLVLDVKDTFQASGWTYHCYTRGGSNIEDNKNIIDGSGQPRQEILNILRAYM